MRDPREWDEAYLLSLPAGEFDWIEFKGRKVLEENGQFVGIDRLRKSLSPAVSAFANSGGGTIVVGIENPRDPASSLSVDGGGVNASLKNPNTREWLEDVIPNLVDFPLSGFNVYAVGGAESGSQIAPGHAVFVIAIPDSPQAPHQAADGLYYGRVAGRSRPLPHRLVLDIWGRRRDPIVNVDLWIIESMRYRSGVAFRPEDAPERVVELVARANNGGRVLAQYVSVKIALPEQLIPRPMRSSHTHEEIDGKSYRIWWEDNTRRDVVDSQPLGAVRYGPSWYEPLLPGLGREWSLYLSGSLAREALATFSGEVHWEAYADNAPVRNGSIRVSDLQWLIDDG
jgi:hypothetical protein